MILKLLGKSNLLDHSEKLDGIRKSWRDSESRKILIAWGRLIVPMVRAVRLTAFKKQIRSLFFNFIVYVFFNQSVLREVIVADHKGLSPGVSQARDRSPATAAGMLNQGRPNRFFPGDRS